MSVQDVLSDFVFLLFGVPRGSVREPTLYVDDTRLYASYDVTDIEHRQIVITQLENTDLILWKH